MKHCILQDSSFLVATMDLHDEFHRDAVYIFKKILENKRDVKIIIPSLVFYETIVTLIKKGGVSREIIEKKLWNFLYSSLVINVALLETNAFKVCKKLINSDISKLKTQDFIISAIGMEYEAQILTFDKQMVSRLKPHYADIYYCSSIGANSIDDSANFLIDFYNKIGKNIITTDDIPF